MIALLVCAILVWVGVEDLRSFRVRNVAVVALCLCFLADCLVHDRWGLLAPHLILAAISFGILAGAYAIRAIGGGDAKLLTAAVLWVGPEGSVVFALALLVLTSLYVLGSRFGGFPQTRLGGRTAIPFGPGIAGAWIITVALEAWAAA